MRCGELAARRRGRPRGEETNELGKLSVLSALRNHDAALLARIAADSLPATGRRAPVRRPTVRRASGPRTLRGPILAPCAHRAARARARRPRTPPSAHSRWYAQWDPVRDLDQAWPPHWTPRSGICILGGTDLRCSEKSCGPRPRMAKNEFHCVGSPPGRPLCAHDRTRLEAGLPHSGHAPRQVCPMRPAGRSALEGSSQQFLSGPFLMRSHNVDHRGLLGETHPWASLILVTAVFPVLLGYPYRSYSCF